MTNRQSVYSLQVFGCDIAGRTFIIKGLIHLFSKLSSDGYKFSLYHLKTVYVYILCSYWNQNELYKVLRGSRRFEVDPDARELTQTNHWQNYKNIMLDFANLVNYQTIFLFSIFFSFLTGLSVGELAAIIVCVTIAALVLIAALFVKYKLAKQRRNEQSAQAIE